MKDELLICIEKSLDWIHSHLSFFSLPAYNLEEEQFMDMPRKRFGELALSLLILTRNQDLKNDVRVKDIAAFIKDTVSAKDYDFNMARNLNLFPFYLMVINGLLKEGTAYPDHQYTLQQIVDSGYITNIERNNWNKIDFRYNLDVAGLKHNMASYQDLYKQSSLCDLPELSYLRNIDIYAITHMIFHLSDFGAADMKIILKEDYNKLTTYMALLTGYYAHKEDWDLLAELLICCHNLNYREFPLFKLCWEKMIQSQNPEGDFTSRYIQKELKLQKIVSQEERFDVNYHPTLVSLFACSLEYNHLVYEN